MERETGMVGKYGLFDDMAPNRRYIDGSGPGIAAFHSANNERGFCRKNSV
jgi:hypothetical protein